eukprot:m.187067 g.187067  ORF g.187067 m.187067 type:complete len:401 (-) comp21615_c0_seq2:1536-2738(-)
MLVAVLCLLFASAHAASIMQKMHLTGLDDKAPFKPETFAPTDAADPNFAEGFFLKDEAQSDGAVCLDGTPSAYYFKQGTGSGANKWYIHHQGGGWCESLDSCYERAHTDLGSSAKYPANSSLSGGYFDSDPAVNPQMYNWNMIFMRYCDGNSFSGNNASTTEYKGMTLHWRGKHILDAMINSVLTARGAAHATDIVVSGCSAGGLATYLHCDYWAEKIAAASNGNAKVRCMPDSGFFLDYEGKPQYHSGMIWAFNQQNSTSGVNQACIQAHTPTHDTELCMFAEHTAPHIKTPMFPLQAAYDSWQIPNDLGVTSSDTTEINTWGKNLTNLVMANLLKQPQHGIFLDSCYHHCGEWGNIRIDGLVQATAFQEWYDKGSEGLANKGFFNQNKAYPCAECCKP